MTDDILEAAEELEKKVNVARKVQLTWNALGVEVAASESLTNAEIVYILHKALARMIDETS